MLSLQKSARIFNMKFERIQLNNIFRKKISMWILNQAYIPIIFICSDDMIELLIRRINWGLIVTHVEKLNFNWLSYHREEPFKIDFRVDKIYDD